MWNYRIIVEEKGNGRKVGLINLETSRTLTRPELIKKAAKIFRKFDGVKVLDYQIEPVRGKSLLAGTKRKMYA